MGLRLTVRSEPPFDVAARRAAHAATVAKPDEAAASLRGNGQRRVVRSFVASRTGRADGPQRPGDHFSAHRHDRTCGRTA